MTQEPITIGTPFYRYESDNWDGTPTFFLMTLYVTKTTPKGAWLTFSWNYPVSRDFPKGTFGDKFVLLYSHKAYAYRTVELAQKSFKRRKLAEKKILSSRLAYVEAVLEKLKESGFENNHPTSYSLENLACPPK